jgi:hypothetical protein
MVWVLVWIHPYRALQLEQLDPHSSPNNTSQGNGFGVKISVSHIVGGQC